MVEQDGYEIQDDEGLRLVGEQITALGNELRDLHGRIDASLARMDAMDRDSKPSWMGRPTLRRGLAATATAELSSPPWVTTASVSRRRRSSAWS